VFLKVVNTLNIFVEKQIELFVVVRIFKVLLMTQLKIGGFDAGWPDWALFRLLGDYLLRSAF
jgi:hypothetical protein